VLAAGAGRRFGPDGPKQLAPLSGRPLLEHVLAQASASPVDRVVVVLGARADAILDGLDLHDADPVVCDSWREGMSSPLKDGIAAVADCAATVVLLGDQPLITAAAVDRVLAARRDGTDATRASYGGRPGHPVVLERRLFAAVGTLAGDAGARSLLAAGRVVAVPCDDVADPLDVDTPADLRLAEQALAS
jgi:nicotine blue oxidoreductase